MVHLVKLQECCTQLDPKSALAKNKRAKAIFFIFLRLERSGKNGKIYSHASTYRSNRITHPNFSQHISTFLIRLSLNLTLSSLPLPSLPSGVSSSWISKLHSVLYASLQHYVLILYSSDSAHKIIIFF